MSQPNKETILSLSKEKGDFEIQFFRAGGKGGQKQNKTSSACRILHRSSGATGECREERSQDTNKRRAFRRCIESQKFQTWLRLELAKLGIGEQETSSVGPTGSRGEKIRTYNMVRQTAKDHRSGYTANVYNILDGDLDELIESLQDQ